MRRFGMPALRGTWWRVVWAVTLVATLLLGALGTPNSAAAASPSTIVVPQTGSDFISSFGVVDTATYGQTITTPAQSVKLNSFTFSLYLASGTASTIRAEVYAWDGAKATGAPLFASGPLVAPSAAAYTPVTVATGGVPLAGNAQYVLSFTTSLDPGQPNSAYRWAVNNSNNAYPGGQFVFQNNGPNHAALTTQAWSTIPRDVAMTLVFDEVATAVTAAGAATFGDATATLSATVTRQSDGQPVPAGGVVTFTLNGQPAGSGTTDASGVATASAPLPAGTGAGTYPGAVGASYAGVIGYAPSNGTGTLTVAKAAQTIDFPQPPAKTYGDPPFTVSATASSGLPVTFAAGPASVCTASGPNGSTITLVGPGACTVTASQAGDANYQPAQDVSRAVGVAPCDGKFTDVAANDPACTAVAALVGRGVIAGYATTPPRFGPDDKVQRAQVAAFLVRALGWQNRPQGPRTFSDFDGLVQDLRTASLIAANACTPQGRCVASGFGDGTFGPTKLVTKAEVIAFISRAFELDSKYAWADQPTGPQPYTGVPAVHETAIRTYTYYAGAIPDAPTTADEWNAPASRAWVARVLYQALMTKP